NLLGPGSIDRTVNGYRIGIEPSDLDVARFEHRVVAGRSAVREGRFEQARAELGDALSLWDGPPWEPLASWPVAAADIARCSELKLQAEEQLARCELVLRDADAAIGRLRVLTSLEPLRERPWALLMEALARSGRTADALRAAHDARTAMTEIAGLEVPASLVELERQILDDALEPLAVAAGAGGVPARLDRQDAPAHPTGMPTPMLGRDRPLAALVAQAAATAAPPGGPRLSAIGGEAGIGKTRLLAELARQCDGDVHWGRCYEAEAAGRHRPGAELLRSVLASAPGAHLVADGMRRDLALLLPELGDDANGAGDATRPDLDEDRAVTRRLVAYDAATRLLVEAASVRPLTLLVDDAHWADTSSLALLDHVVRHADGAAIHLVVAYRNEEVRAGEGFGRWLRDVQRYCPTQHLPLDGLDVREVAALLAAPDDTRPSPPLDPRAAPAVHEATGGNPLFVLQLASHLREADPLGDALSAELLLRELPPGVTAVIERRLARLSADATAVLQLVAASPAGAPHELVARAASDDVGSLLDAVEELLGAAVVEEASPRGDIHYQCRHAAFRHVAFGSLSSARQAHVHHRLAAAADELAAHDAGRWLDALAYHWWRAGRSGNPRRAVEANRDAARSAVTQTAYDTAIVHLDRALDALDWSAAGPAERAELLVRRAEVDNYLGRTDEREADARAGFAAAVEVGDGSLMTAAALVHGGARSTYGQANETTMSLLYQALEHHDPVGRAAEAVATTGADAVAAVGGEDADRARLLARLAQELYHVNRFDESLRLSGEACDLARSIGDDRLLTAVFHGRAWTLNQPDGLSERFELAGEMIDRAERSGDRELAITSHIWRCAAQLEIGDLAAFDVDLARIDELAREVLAPSDRFRVATLHATRALLAGNVGEGMALAAAAHQIGLEVETENAEQVYHAQLIAPLRDQGLLAASLPLVDDLVERYSHVPSWRCAFAFVYSEAAATLGERGPNPVPLGERGPNPTATPGERGPNPSALERARELFDALAADDFASVPRDLAWMQAHAFLAESAVILGDRRGAAELYRLLSPYASRNVALWDIAASGSVAGYLGLLAHFLGDDAAASGHLEAAIAFNQRSGQVPALLRSQAALVAVLARRGERSVADRLADEVATRAGGLGLAGIAAQVDRLRTG
ncbi:MAG: AAA family ATPase, partial [Acidimicrobiia bacterium]|nr:AAA family ATPase [Acidimicrobiia bacterium]